MSEEKMPIAIPIAELKALAASVAQQMKAVSGPLPRDLRARFITVRAALFQRGIYDPVLVRFDSATVAPASLSELANELGSIAASL
jgi:hypothetical protein